jgi:hypothetical protein
MLPKPITLKARALVVAGVLCGCLLAAAAAWAAETLTVSAKFTPDKLGKPTNISATATFATTTGGLPSPIEEVTAYGPAGVELKPEGVGICNPVKLEQTLEPGVCPKNSKAGYGGGVGTLELAKEIIKEPFTLNFYRGPNEGGQVTALVYVNAVTPVSVQLVLRLHVIHGPKPYGLGFTFKVPQIPTLPGATDASVESSFLTIGSANAAYFEKVHGKRKLVHIKGIIVPKKCPHGGFPYKTIISYWDGTSNTVTGTLPCPGK